MSPEKQHVQPARPGEVQPLQLGNNLTLDVSCCVGMSWRVCAEHQASQGDTGSARVNGKGCVCAWGVDTWARVTPAAAVGCLLQ